MTPQTGPGTVAARGAVDPVSWAVETMMCRALAVLRVVVLVNAVVLTALKWDELARPGVGLAALVAMTLWTGFATWGYDEPRRRHAPLLLADLVVALVMIGLTLVVQSDQQLQNITTLPSFWVMAVVLAWGIHWNWVGGLVGASIVSAADLVIRSDITQTNLGNVFLLMIGGPLIGYCAMLLKQMAAARDHAERRAAAAAERARLARVVHDGVLQVLSLMQRRGLDLGGEAADLGRLAGEQEVALRSLIQQGDSSSFGSSGDLARSLSQLQSSRVTVSAPGSPVIFPAVVVEEVTAVVRACLDNVSRHVGPDALAWVLLEDIGPSVIVTVRDEGPGIPTGRIEEARVEGRLGVSQSICGRVADLGGTANLVTAPGQGTEWELTLHR